MPLRDSSPIMRREHSSATPTALARRRCSVRSRRASLNLLANSEDGRQTLPSSEATVPIGVSNLKSGLLQVWATPDESWWEPAHGRINPCPGSTPMSFAATLCALSWASDDRSSRSPVILGGRLHRSDVTYPCSSPLGVHREFDAKHVWIMRSLRLCLLMVDLRHPQGSRSPAPPDQGRPQR